MRRSSARTSWPLGMTCSSDTSPPVFIRRRATPTARGRRSPTSTSVRHRCRPTSSPAGSPTVTGGQAAYSTTRDRGRSVPCRLRTLTVRVGHIAAEPAGRTRPDRRCGRGRTRVPGRDRRAPNARLADARRPGLSPVASRAEVEQPREANGRVTARGLSAVEMRRKRHFEDARKVRPSRGIGRGSRT